MISLRSSKSVESASSQSRRLPDQLPETPTNGARSRGFRADTADVALTSGGFLVLAGLCVLLVIFLPMIGYFFWAVAAICIVWHGLLRICYEKKPVPLRIARTGLDACCDWPGARSSACSRAGFRDDGKSQGEHCAICFRRERFEELGERTFWLEEPIDQPRLDSALDIKRICSWVGLRDRESYAAESKLKKNEIAIPSCIRPFNRVG